MNRIAVIGCSGSGKTTLARRLGERLNVPVVHLDKLFWRPGWVESPQPVFAARVAESVRRDRWILDGTFRATWHIVMPAADTVIWLDFPRHVCLWRVTKRLSRYLGRTRPDLPDGCPEKIDLEFVEYIWRFNEDYRPRIIARLDQRRPDQRLIVLRGPGDVARFIREMGSDR